MILDAAGPHFETVRVARDRDGTPARARGTGVAGRSALFVVHPVAVLTTSAVLIVVVCAICMVTIDTGIARAMVFAPAWLRSAARVVTELGTSAYMMFAAASVSAFSWWAMRQTHEPSSRVGLRCLSERAFYVLASVVVSGLGVQLLKHVVGRARPKLIDTFGAGHFDWFSIKHSLASFPSGHATSIFALTVALGLVLPRVGRPMIALALVVGASRVVVGAHYASDVIGGAALGTIVSLGMALVFADRNLAFTRTREVLRLKECGLIWPAVRAAVGYRTP